jgi:hypothetical protein
VRLFLQNSATVDALIEEMEALYAARFGQ